LTTALSERHVLVVTTSSTATVLKASYSYSVLAASSTFELSDGTVTPIVLLRDPKGERSTYTGTVKDFNDQTNSVTKTYFTEDKLPSGSLMYNETTSGVS